MITLGGWKGKDVEHIFSEFELEQGEREAVDEVLLAYYDTDAFDSRAFVLYKYKGALYEVNASHCSCYGLEGQWEPEPTVVGALLHRLDKGYLGRSLDENLFADELIEIISKL